MNVLHISKQNDSIIPRSLQEHQTKKRKIQINQMGSL